MTQIWKNDAVVAISPLKLKEKSQIKLFKEGEFVKIIGFTKGKGFQGVVKRYGFGGGPKTHGQKNRLRAPGSIGSTAPQRVLPGRKMPGRMGGDKRTTRDAEIMAVNNEQGSLSVRGSLPGNIGGKLTIVKPD